MSIVRVYTDVPPDEVGFLVDTIEFDGGTYTKQKQEDGSTTIVATFEQLETVEVLPIETASAGFRWMEIARAEMGQKEVGGSGSNPRIEAYHATTLGGKADDSVPWCSSFVNFCITNSGLNGTNSKMARSWAKWGKDISDFRPGCIVVLERGKPPSGHVGFYIGRDGDRIQLLGGNQSDAVNISSYDEARVIARRLPDSVPAVESIPDRWMTALKSLVTSGASARTAGQDQLPAGLEASRKMAQHDLERARKFLTSFQKAGEMHDIPPVLLAAIASRESRCGSQLRQDGTGDNGNGYGIMQVDKRYHAVKSSGGPGGFDHIEQAATILGSFRSQIQKRFPDWDDRRVLRGSTAAYNCGPANVQSWEGVDERTTGKDYSSDVIARAQLYSETLV